jgi:cyclopropane-fatty-acyl-phospholipid synthase
MHQAAISTSDSSLSLARACDIESESRPEKYNALKSAFARIGKLTEVCFRVIFRDGSIMQNHNRPPVVTVIFKTRYAERRMALFGHVGLLEGYFNESIDIDGDVGQLFCAALDSGFHTGVTSLVALRNQWHEWRQGNNTVEQAKANARYHYGLGREFYQQWLDEPTLTYSCGYWTPDTTTLEQAQRNKLDHVCRKVQLQAGETFVDIGSGFGGLLFHAWEHYGALGTGINTTTEQVREVRAEIARRGLKDTIRVIEQDFRKIPGQYDKMLSIGSLEHAGRDQLHGVIRAHADCLKKGGLGVIHFTGHVGVHETEFMIRKHIFPGSWIPSLAEAMMWMEYYGLEILDVENLRHHHALTLDCWAENFDKKWEVIHFLDPQRFNETFRRKWRTYLYSCAEMFRSKNSSTHLFQVTVSKGNVGRNYPMSRKFLYQ